MIHVGGIHGHKVSLHFANCQNPYATQPQSLNGLIQYLRIVIFSDNDNSVTNIKYLI